MDAEQYGKQVGKWLRYARVTRHMSLAKVEEASGGRWNQAAVASYERGDRCITVEKLAELAAFYHLPVRYLLPPEDASSGMDTACKPAGADASNFAR